MRISYDRYSSNGSRCILHGDFCVMRRLAGSLDKADPAQAARGKMRTGLGSETIQEATLK